MRNVCPQTQAYGNFCTPLSLKKQLRARCWGFTSGVILSDVVATVEGLSLSAWRNKRFDRVGNKLSSSFLFVGARGAVDFDFAARTLLSSCSTSLSLSSSSLSFAATLRRRRFLAITPFELCSALFVVLMMLSFVLLLLVSLSTMDRLPVCCTNERVLILSMLCVPPIFQVCGV